MSCLTYIYIALSILISSGTHISFMWRFSGVNFVCLKYLNSFNNLSKKFSFINLPWTYVRVLLCFLYFTLRVFMCLMFVLLIRNIERNDRCYKREITMSLLLDNVAAHIPSGHENWKLFRRLVINVVIWRSKEFSGTSTYQCIPKWLFRNEGRGTRARIIFTVKVS